MIETTKNSKQLKIQSIQENSSLINASFCVTTSSSRLFPHWFYGSHLRLGHSSQGRCQRRRHQRCHLAPRRRRRDRGLGFTARGGGFSLMDIHIWYIGLFPHPVTVTTRIVTFLIGNPYKPSFVTVTGRGNNPIYHICISMVDKTI